MDRHDEQFENFLREFKPRRPRALPDAIRVDASVWRRRLAAAALIAAAGGSALWFWGQSSTRDESVIARKQVTAPAGPKWKQVPSAAVLTRLALEDPDHLDAILAASRVSRLPRFDRENSILQILAKE